MTSLIQSYFKMLYKKAKNSYVFQKDKFFHNMLIHEHIKNNKSKMETLVFFILSLG